MKPFGFSLSGDFYDATYTEGTRDVRQMWQTERDGIPNLAQIAEGCRPLSVQTRETAFAVGAALRYFVSENKTGSADDRMKTTGTKIPDTLDHIGLRCRGERKKYLLMNLHQRNLKRLHDKLRLLV